MHYLTFFDNKTKVKILPYLSICSFSCRLTNPDIIIYNAYMTTKEEILTKLKEIKPALNEKFYIKNLGLFGSYIRGENSPSSDIDILIEYDESKSFSIFTIIALEDFLTKLFNIKVDLVNKKSIKPDLKDYILNEVVFV